MEKSLHTLCTCVFQEEVAQAPIHTMVWSVDFSTAIVHPGSSHINECSELPTDPRQQWTHHTSKATLKCFSLMVLKPTFGRENHDVICNSMSQNMLGHLR